MRLLLGMAHCSLVVWSDVGYMAGFPSGQRGQTVNLLAYAFEGSSPSLATTPL